VGSFPRFHEDKGREISVNISRITALPTPKSPPKKGLSNLKTPIEVSKVEVDKFTSLFQHDAIPIQSLHGRVVRESE